MRISTLLLSVMLAAAAGNARAVTLDIGNGAGTVGDTVLVAVTTTDLTGLGIYSYELSVTWSSTYATAIGAPVTGTVTSPWGAATVHPTPGRVDVAAAGATPLTGAGNLIYLQFVLGPSASTVTLTFAGALFNEGSPTATLVNGQLSISALPVVSISPNSGLILVGETLAFNASGGSPPYTFSTSNAGIASFGGTSTLTGLAPGSVTATATDNNGISRTTSGLVEVRAIRLTAGTAAGSPGDTLLVPVSITNPAPYAVKSAEFSLNYNETYLTAVGVSQTGTIAATAGWAAPAFSVSFGSIHVALAGPNNLAGPGVLTYVKFVIDSPGANTIVPLTPSNGLFNENLPSLNADGSVSVGVLSAITVSPNTSTIVAGDQLQFYISGTTTPPVTWNVTNPLVATIDVTGKLTATKAGVTQVYATDNAGRTDITDVIRICDLYLMPPTQSIFYTTPVPVPIQTDRSITGKGIYGYELTLTFDPAKVFVAGVSTTGCASSAWGTPVYNVPAPGTVVVVHAGATPLAGVLPLVNVLFQSLVPTSGSTSALTITKILFNEGTPCALVHPGSLVTGVGGSVPAPLQLDQNVPNPFNPHTSISYRVRVTGPTMLRVYGANGRLVRTLVNGVRNAGAFNQAEWDGTDDAGHRVPSGVYFCRLESAGETRTMKMLLLK